MLTFQSRRDRWILMRVLVPGATHAGEHIFGNGDAATWSALALLSVVTGLLLMPVYRRFRTLTSIALTGVGNRRAFLEDMAQPG